MVTPSSQTRSCAVTVSAPSFPCLQCVNICCVFVGDISFEVKTEADSNDITQYPYHDMPSTGMIVFHHECILCTMFDVLPVTPPRYIIRLYVCRKKSLTSLSDRQQYCVGQICSTKHNTRFRSLLAQKLSVDTYRHCRMSVHYCCVLVFSIVS